MEGPGPVRGREHPGAVPHGDRIGDDERSHAIPAPARSVGEVISGPSLPSRALRVIAVAAGVALAASAFSSGVPSAQSSPRYQRVYPLKAEEGVFAYSRISPDGKTLAYASETAVSP